MFALEDYGPGIHTTLPANARLSDLKGKKSSSLLRLALEEGITGTAQIGRGLGLFYLSRLVADNHAETLLASNCGLVIQHGDVFYEKDLKNDISRNLIIIKIIEPKAGL